MRQSFWKHLFSRTWATSSRQKAQGRPLHFEELEAREVLTVAHPAYVILPTGNAAHPFASTGPSGYTPSQMRQAYGFANISFGNGTVAGDGSGTTIAIVDAYDDPTIASDLHQFDLKFGLPDPTFKKVNQSGGTSMPTADSGWAEEIALDVEWAHAIAPKASILLVEASSSSFSNLLTAVHYAASQPGVVAVSMSWGGGEFSGETSYDSYFTTPSGHAGVTFVASSGDSGAPASYPAASPNVLAVGGTSLHLSSGSYSSESAWSGSGGGISTVESQPSYQKGVVTQSTTKRTNPDVAYDADPNTGVPVYDSYSFGTAAPWAQFGGTSAAAPQWAALIAIADQGRALAGLGSLTGASTLAKIYSLPASDFHDITTGSSTGSPHESAGAGYDLATGRGTPIANLVVAGLVGSSTSTTPGAPSKLAFGQQPTSTTVGAALSPAVTVHILDGNGNLETADNTDTITLALGSDPGGATLGGTLTATVHGGIATFSNLTLNQAGTSYTLVASSGSLSDATSNSFNISAASTSTPAPSGLVEGFETSDSWYIAGGSTIDGYMSTSAAHDGSYGLDQYNGSQWIYRTDAAAQLKAGDTASVWLKFAGTADGRAYFGFGASSRGTFSLVAAPNTGQLLLQSNASFGFTNLAAVSQSYLANHWYRLEVDWGTSGKIVGKLFDSNGTTLLSTVTATSTTFTAGGIAFRATGSDKYWDTVTTSHGVNSFTPAPKAGVFAAPAPASGASVPTELQALMAWLSQHKGSPPPADFWSLWSSLPATTRAALDHLFAAWAATGW